MSKPRFYCAELAPGLITLDDSESRHALQSLRLRPGSEVVLFDGHGRLAHGVLQAEPTAAGRRPRRRAAWSTLRAAVAVERVLCEPPPDKTLTLIVAGSKGARLTWMVEKLTELGVTGIVIAEFERSVVVPRQTRVRRLRRTALEAAKQSQRVWLPEIQCGATLADALDRAGEGCILVAHRQEEAASLSTWLHARPPDTHMTGVIGPEGGLTEAEVALLTENGGELVRLAQTILRVETAAVAFAANWAARPTS
jgi:16S rRNA (uracil1498-N3)-methyltransferase